MIYSGFEDNRDMVVRVIADLLHTIACIKNQPDRHAL